ATSVVIAHRTSSRRRSRRPRPALEARAAREPPGSCPPSCAGSAGHSRPALHGGGWIARKTSTSSRGSVWSHRQTPLSDRQEPASLLPRRGTVVAMVLRGPAVGQHPSAA